MYNKCDFAVFDFETNGLGDGKQPVELACVIIDGHKLTVKDQGIYSSVCSIIPDDEVDLYGLDKTSQKALDVNKLTMKDIAAAPPLKKVWSDFENFLQYHNPSGNQYENPIMVAHNLDFDKQLLDNIKLGLHRGKPVMPSKPLPLGKIKDQSQDDLKKHVKDWRPFKEPWKFSSRKIFHPIQKIDTLQNCFNWFSYQREPYRLNQVAICEFLELDTSMAHGALFDVLTTAEILIRMIKIQRIVSAETDFKTGGITHLPIAQIMKENGR